MKRLLCLAAILLLYGKAPAAVKVTDPNGAYDQKPVPLSVIADTSSQDNGTHPDKTITVGSAGIWESSSADTLLYADVGDTLNLSIYANVGAQQANGFELFIAVDSRYLTPIDQETTAGVQPFRHEGILPASSVLINSALDLPDTAYTHLRYTEVSLSGTATATAAVADLALRVTRAIPAQGNALVTIENDTLNQRKTSFTIKDIGENFPLLPRNRIRILNRPPTLNIPANLSVFEDETLVIDLNPLVQDREFTQAQMRWSVSALVSGFTIALSQNVGSQQATIHALPNWNGITTLIFQVTDPDGVSISKTSLLTVVPVNDPPTLSQAIKQGVFFNEDDSFIAALDTLASDPDNAPGKLRWSIQNGHSVSATIDTLARRLRIVSPPNWNGKDTLQVTVTDTAGAADQANVIVTVYPVNDPPTFISSLPELTNTTRDTLLDLSAYVTDIDNAPETLTWSVSGAQKIGATMETQGLLRLTFPANWGGSETLTVTVTDTSKASAEAPLRISAVLTGDFSGDGQVGFEDFLLFAQHFGTHTGDPTFSADYDLDGDGQVGFADFIQFAAHFGTGQ